MGIGVLFEESIGNSHYNHVLRSDGLYQLTYK